MRKPTPDAAGRRIWIRPAPRHPVAAAPFWRRSLFLAAGLTLCLATAQPAQTETLGPDWEVTGNGTSGTIFVATDGSGLSQYYVILTPFIAMSQVVSLAVGSYRLDYFGDPLVTHNSFSPTTITPSVSGAGNGTQLSTTTENSSGDLSFFSVEPTTLHSDIFTVTSAGAATLTFEFATEDCQTDSAWLLINGYCAANFDFDNVVLTLLSLSPIAGFLPEDTPTNAMNVAEAIDPFTADVGTFPADFVDIYARSQDEQINALLQISGELGTGVQQSRFNADDAFMGAMFSSGLGAKDQDDLGRGLRFWASFHGGSARASGNAETGASDFSNITAGLSIGGTSQLASGALLGFALGTSRSGYSVTGGTGQSNLFHAAVNLRQDWGSAYLSGGLGLAVGSTRTNRLVAVSAEDRLEAEFNATSFMARAEAGLDLTGGRSSLTPFVAYQASVLRLPAYGETATSGDDTFALDYEAKTVQASRTELGLRWIHALETANGVQRLIASATWVHNVDTERTATAGFASLPGSSFEVAGAEASGDSLLLSVSGEVAHANGWVMSANLASAFGDNSTSLSAGLRFDLKF